MGFRLFACTLVFSQVVPVLALGAVWPPISSATTRPQLGSLENEPKREQVSGIDVLVGLNARLVCSPQSIRFLEIFVQPESFSVHNLKQIFLHLSERYPREETLYIGAASDRKRFLKQYNQYAGEHSFLWCEAPVVDSFSSKEVGLSALYSRTENDEWFTYYPGKSKGQSVVVKLRTSTIGLHFSGDSALDLVATAKFGDTEAIRTLLENNVDVNVKTKYGGSALPAAVYTGQEQAVRFLLESGADVNQTTSAGWTALMCAISSTRLSILELLLSRQPDVNLKTEDGLSALAIAVRHNLVGVVKELLVRGADPMVTDAYGRTPLSIAKEKHNADIIRLLEDAGARR
jgi:ankyrin repeat protein